MKRGFAVCAFALLVVSVALAQRLPAVARPENYKLTFTPDLDKATFAGDETISIRVLKPTSEITLNAIDIDFEDVSMTSGGGGQETKKTYAKEKRTDTLTGERQGAGGGGGNHHR